MSPRLLALIPVAVAINLVIGRIVAELALPVYLDTLGTMLVSVLAGLSGGLLIGTVSQVLAALLGGYVWIAFTPIQWLIAVLAAVAAMRGGFASSRRTAVWGVMCGVVCGLTSAFISYAVYRGVSVSGVTAVATLLRSLGLSLPAAVTVASLATDVLDKTIAFVFVGMLLRSLPRRILGRFPLAARSVGR